jgi:O-methyltransferase domain/Dimerisation domain
MAASTPQAAPTAGEHREEKPPHAILFEMSFGAWTSKLLTEVVRLDVPDALAAGPMSASELVARGVKANSQALHRALRACAALGIFTEDTTGRFGATRLSALLTRDTPGSLKRSFEYSGALLWQVWSGLEAGLATGQPQARTQLGMEFFDYLAAHPIWLQTFGETLKAHSAVTNKGVLERYDFSGIRHIVDVGGAFGHLMIGVLERYPEIVRAMVFDRPETVAMAPIEVPVRNASVAARLDYVGGNMFEDVPPADAYVLKFVLHNWDDASCARLLQNVSARLERGGRVICIDSVLPPLGDTSNVPGKLQDLNMMLLLPGRERTRAEWEAFYNDAGLAITAMIPVPDTFGAFVIEGRRTADA